VRDVVLLTLWVAGAEYAFPVPDVVELVPEPKVTRVPGGRPPLAGVTNWRGRTIPVLDLAALLKVADAPPDVKRKLLVLRRPGPCGVLVQRPGRVVPAVAAGPVQLLDPARLIGDGRDLVRGGTRS